MAPNMSGGIGDAKSKAEAAASSNGACQSCAAREQKSKRKAAALGGEVPSAIVLSESKEKAAPATATL